MSDISNCITEFSTAAALGAAGAEERARLAIERMLAPFDAYPLRTISKLYALLDDFRDLKIVSRAGVAISDDIVDRIQRIEQAMLTRSAAQALFAQAGSKDADISPPTPC